jgi:hypothetical protein
MSCCQVEGIQEQFNDKAVAKTLKRYRRRGPDKSTQVLIDALRRALDESDVRNGSLLDVGAGLGAVHHSLLNGRVARATHVDASPAQIGIARAETAHRGHADRVDFIAGDFVTLADRIEPADVVTLDRVICCYDDMPRLVAVSGAKARRFYGAVYPRRVFWMKIGMAVINAWMRVRRSQFRTFLHSPDEIEERLRGAGLQPRSREHTAGWEIAVYERRI